MMRATLEIIEKKGIGDEELMKLKNCLAAGQPIRRNAKLDTR